MRFVKILSIITLCVILSLSCFAAESQQFYFSDIDTTVTFAAQMDISASALYELARSVAYGTYEEESSNFVQPQAISLCGIFGHKINSTLMYTVKHKVASKQPRCLETTYEVETCERCSYQNVKYVTDAYICCCPND